MGVFTRFVLNSASSWPEPLAVLLMIWLAFLSAVVCYREYLHIGVGVIPALLTALRAWLSASHRSLHDGHQCVHVLVGYQALQATWFQSIAEFPAVSVGVSYLPVPIGGLLVVLFVIERFWTQVWFQEPTLETTSTLATE